jgi:hypothetical protein
MEIRQKCFPVFAGLPPGKNSSLRLDGIFLLQAAAELVCVVLVAPKAKRADVRQIAFAAAFCDRENMIRIPETPAVCVKIQLATQSLSFGCGDQLESAIKLNGVQAADCADAAVSRQNMVPQIAGIRSQTPFMDATIVAERAASFRHFRSAPSAYASTVGSALFGAKNPAAGFLPQSAHSVIFQAGLF